MHRAGKKKKTKEHTTRPPKKQPGAGWVQNESRFVITYSGRSETSHIRANIKGKKEVQGKIREKRSGQERGD